MTEPVDDPIDPPPDETTDDSSGETSEWPTPERPLSRLADILEQFKAGSARADDHRVNDRASDGTRLSWESVTEGMPAPTPGTSTAEERPTSFQFDLGSALQRLGTSGEDVSGTTRPTPQAPLEPLPQRATSTSTPAPPRVPAAPVSQPPIADLPVRNRGATQSVSSPTPEVQTPPASAPAVTTHDSEPPISRRMPEDLPTRRQAPAGSVFDSVAPAPTLPATPQVTPPPAPAAVRAAPQPTLPPAAPVATPAPAMTPSIPAGALPTLPPAAPAMSPVMTAPIETAPSTPDLNALRSAQLRAKKQQNKGKMLSRSLLAFVLIGVAAGGALLFGRDYLFSVDWDRSLTPIVDQIQLERGQEFDHAVGLIIEPPDAYAETVSELVLGADWSSRLPAWRALGLVGGDATASSVAAALATNVSAVYEPDADVIYRLAGATDVAPLRIALEEAWVAQVGVEPATAADGDVESAPADPTAAGLLGTSSVESIVRRAVDLAALEARTSQPMGGVVAGSGLPLPVAYELQAGGELGAALLATADLSPTTFEYGMPFPETLVGAFDDTPSRAAPPVLREGDIPADPPVALGVDDWGLVWGAKLPASSVDRMTEVLTRDVYRTFTRGTASCFVAVFETDTEPRGALLLSALIGWSSSAPAKAQAVATQLSPTSVQLEACDPGADAPVPDASSVDGVIARQIARLSS